MDNLRKEQQPNILDRHDQAIASILRRFRDMMLVATEALPSQAIIEGAALNRMALETQSSALIAEVQNLLTINREIKSLWIRGPPRLPGDDDQREADLDTEAQHVANLYNRVVEMRERNARDQAAREEADGPPQGDGTGSGSVDDITAR